MTVAIAVAGRRAGRRTNIALLVLLPLAFATGWLAFGVGTIWPARIITIAHAVVGFAIVALIPWKQLIARRGLRRRSRSPARGVAVKATSLALVAFTLLSLAAGVAHSLSGSRSYLGLTDMQLHVGGAVVATVLLGAHLVTRPQRIRATDLSRRNALRFAGLLGVAAAAYGATEAVAAVAGLPGWRRRATGSFAADPQAMPTVAWLFDRTPAIDATTYALAVRTGGATAATGSTTTIGYADLAAGTDTVRAVLDCTGGWYAEQTWRGVRVDRFLPAVPAGHVIVVRSATGYTRRFPGTEASSLWLATFAGGLPLDAGHGAPVRLVAPGRRGFWWVKWVVEIRTEPGPAWWQPPFPLQ